MTTSKHGEHGVMSLHLPCVLVREDIRRPDWSGVRLGPPDAVMSIVSRRTVAQISPYDICARIDSYVISHVTDRNGLTNTCYVGYRTEYLYVILINNMHVQNWVS